LAEKDKRFYPQKIEEFVEKSKAKQMKLKSITIEQKIVFIYMIIGIVCGLVSSYFTATNLSYALMLPVAIYAVATVPLLRMAREHKTSMVISNSLVTFLLVWILVWVFLYNI